MLRSTCLALLAGSLLVACGSVGEPGPVKTPPGDGGGNDGGGGGGNFAPVLPAGDYSVAVPFGPRPGDAATKGQWSAVVGGGADGKWPTLAIHTTLLPNGKVMTFGGNYYPNWEQYAGDANVEYNNVYDLWDPATNQHQVLDYLGSALFCGGHTLLPDGSLLIAGGDDLSKLERHRSYEAGIRDTHIYDYKNDQWNKVASMKTPRWYPTTTLLPNGEVLAVAGNTVGSATFAAVPEVYNPRTDTWRSLSGAEAKTDFYPWLFVASNGKVFNAGPDKDEVGWIDTSGAGNWTYDTPDEDGVARMRRDYGTAVMFDHDKILVLGGGGSDERGNTPKETSSLVAPSKDAILVDLTGGNAKFSQLPDMNYRRRFHNATLLPDGTVLVTGGTQAYGFNNAKFTDVDPIGKAGQQATVLVPELWDPKTGKFTQLAPMKQERIYHSTALLLPDATVLVAGGGACDPGGEKDTGTGESASGCYEWESNAGYDKYRDAEVFKPPYLFKGERPSIRGVSDASVNYGQTFAVSTADASGIDEVTLVRLGSVTHSFNMNQRINKLNFTKGNGQLAVTAPANANVAPPGQYMLFILRDGVPSVARIITVK